MKIPEGDSGGHDDQAVISHGGIQLKESSVTIVRSWDTSAETAQNRPNITTNQLH